MRSSLVVIAVVTAITANGKSACALDFEPIKRIFRSTQENICIDQFKEDLRRTGQDYKWRHGFSSYDVFQLKEIRREGPYEDKRTFVFGVAEIEGRFNAPRCAQKIENYGHIRDLNLKEFAQTIDQTDRATARLASALNPKLNLEIECDGAAISIPGTSYDEYEKAVEWAKFVGAQAGQYRGEFPFACAFLASDSKALSAQWFRNFGNNRDEDMFNVFTSWKPKR